MLPLLSLLETRALGVLIEKERTVPDTYPLTLNALLSGCNQKTSRDPVLSAAETEVQSALDSLKRMSLVIESSGGRVARYSHNAERVLHLPAQACSLLAVLMLRGPQTVGEIKGRTERIYAFADLDETETVLQKMMDRAEGALVQRLPHAPGTKEPRYAQTLGGEVEVAAPVVVSAPVHGGMGERVAALEGEVSRLREEVNELRRRLDEVLN